MKFLRNLVRSSRLFNFNMVERDSWVRKQAQSVPPGSSVLDVGAGSCPYREWFAHCTYKSQDFEQLEPNQCRDVRGYGRIDYRSDVTNIPVPDASFDVVLCTEVIEHVPEPIKVVEEIGRILKPGGKLLLTAPLGSGLHQAPYHFYGGYTPYWYEKFLAQAGFSKLTIEANGGFFKHFSQEAIRWCRMTAPWNLQARMLARILWAPCWLLLAPWFGLIGPLVCHLLDRFDQERAFTIGYHVLAEKARRAA